MESGKTCFPSENTFKQTKYIYLYSHVEVEGGKWTKALGYSCWFIAGTMGFDTHRQEMIETSCKKILYFV